MNSKLQHEEEEEEITCRKNKRRFVEATRGHLLEKDVAPFAVMAVSKVKSSSLHHVHLGFLLVHHVDDFLDLVYVFSDYLIDNSRLVLVLEV
ncbi:hypothetical protein L1987_59453 [Smallanthus sonchifolius]|uniref:Uncharacterized protein n=1 Tax=Smallanthus sonchifolius TaxID=185202 RepID=A0ACB9D610_9ASTR|nr:hypothetical protein L1987_59453 [Smallanthus sonchifolius]